MKYPLLPPRGIFVVTALLFDRELAPQIKETLMQFMALAWSSPYHETPPMTFLELAKLTGKSDTTLHGHVAMLRNYRAALRLRRAGYGVVVATLADWLFDTRQGGYSDYSPINNEFSGFPVILPENQEQQEEEEEESESSPPLPDDLICAENPENGMQSMDETIPKLLNNEQSELLPPAVSKTLLEAGIFSFLFPEIARIGRPQADLLALLAWCQDDYPERPGGIFMARLRGGTQVPARFYGERCSLCGKLNGHSETCRRRYESWLGEKRS